MWIYIGLAAALLTTIAFLPQVIKTIRTRQTRDISLLTYMIFTTSLFLWLVYGLSIMDLPLIISNSITFCFAFIVLLLKVKHN